MSKSVELKFRPGHIVATPGAMDAMTNEAGEGHGTLAMALLRRHLTGDGGELDAHDREANEYAIAHGERILSAYTLPKTQVKLWVITEADRSATTYLLPDEY